MNEGTLVSLIAMFGWLILVAGAFRARRIGARRTIVLGLTWLAIFIAVALAFSLLGR